VCLCVCVCVCVYIISIYLPEQTMHSHSHSSLDLILGPEEQGKSSEILTQPNYKPQVLKAYLFQLPIQVTGSNPPWTQLEQIGISKNVKNVKIVENVHRISYRNQSLASRPFFTIWTQNFAWWFPSPSFNTMFTRKLVPPRKTPNLQNFQKYIFNVIFD
jgi:hypothetical protein